MEDVAGDTDALKKAENYGEFRKTYMEYVEMDIELSTAREIARIRNTINMLD